MSMLQQQSKLPLSQKQKQQKQNKQKQNKKDTGAQPEQIHFSENR